MCLCICVLKYNKNERKEKKTDATVASSLYWNQLFLLLIYIFLTCWLFHTTATSFYKFCQFVLFCLHVLFSVVVATAASTDCWWWQKSSILPTQVNDTWETRNPMKKHEKEEDRRSSSSFFVCRAEMQSYLAIEL